MGLLSLEDLFLLDWLGKGGGAEGTFSCWLLRDRKEKDVDRIGRVEEKFPSFPVCVLAF